MFDRNRPPRRLRRGLAGLGVAALTAGLLPLGAGVAAAATARDIQEYGCPPDRVPDAGFSDDDTSIHEVAINCVAWYGIASGTSSGDYRPGFVVTRGQMATFLLNVIKATGAVEIPNNPPDAFDDDNGHTHEQSINILADLGIVNGRRDTEDVDNDGDTNELVYLPNGRVQRDQMTTFINNAHAEITGARLSSNEDFFTDDDNSVHEANINALAAAGIASGVSETTYNPGGSVSRAAMASFLAREVDLLVQQKFLQPPVEGLFDVLLDNHEVKQGRLLTGGIALDNGESVSTLTASGCSLSGSEVFLDDDLNFSLAIPANQAPGDCDLQFDLTADSGRDDTEIVTITVLESETVLDGPELVGTQIIDVGSDDVTIRFNFDEEILEAIEPSNFSLISFAGDEHPAFAAERVTGNVTAVDATFERAHYDVATAATVIPFAVQDVDGNGNPESGVGVQAISLGEGETAQPNLESVNGSTSPSTSRTFTFDKVAYEVGATGTATEAFHIVYLNPNNSFEDVTSSGATGNGSKNWSVTFPQPNDPNAVALRAYVEAGTVSVTDDDQEGVTADAANAQQAVDIATNQSATPHLTGIIVDAENDQVQFQFSEAVTGQNDPDPADCIPMITCPADNEATGYHVYFVDGSSATSSTFTNGPGNRVVTAQFADGAITDLVIGGYVEQGYVLDANGNDTNGFDEEGIAKTFAEGETAAPDLLSVTRTLEQTGEDTSQYIVTYTFDQDADDASSNGTVYLYQSNGAKLNLRNGDGDTDYCSVSGSEMVCTVPSDSADFETVGSAVLASATSDAVRDTSESFGNYATSVRLS